MSRPYHRTTLRLIPFFIDLVIVMFFSLLGRESHTQVLNIAGLFSTSWPFIAGLILCTLVVLYVGSGSLAELWPAGVLLACGTPIVGQIIRTIFVGFSLPFAFVSFGFLGLGIMSWRVIVTVRRR